MKHGYCPDNYDCYREYESEQESQLSRLPICYECGEPIQSDECYELNGELICPQCLEENHKKWVDDYIV